MLVDRGETADVKATAGSGYGDVGEAGFGVADPAGKGASEVVLLFAAGWRLEVVGDPHARPFTAFGLVHRRDGHMGVGFVGKLVHRSEDGFGAVGVDKVDERLEVASSRVVGSVVLEFAPG